MTQKLAVLVSGSGTLLDAIVAAQIPVALVVADRPCLGLDKAKEQGIETILVPRGDFKPNGVFDREAYTQFVVDKLVENSITFVSMAGWMTIFTSPIFTAFGENIINNHPSLLPKHKGEKAVEDALAAGDKVTGCTIHVATLKLDDGPILAQAEVPVLPGDTIDSLHTRIKEAEYPLLVKVLREQLGISQ